MIVKTTLKNVFVVMKMMNLCWRLSSLFLPIGISYPHQQKLAKAAITRRSRGIKKSEDFLDPGQNQGKSKEEQLDYYESWQRQLFWITIELRRRRRMVWWWLRKGRQKDGGNFAEIWDNPMIRTKILNPLIIKVVKLVASCWQCRLIFLYLSSWKLRW